MTKSLKALFSTTFPLHRFNEATIIIKIFNRTTDQFLPQFLKNGTWDVSKNQNSLNTFY